MTILFDYSRIWKENNFHRDGHTLEATIRWMHRQAAQHGIGVETADMAMREIMQEIVAGRVFPLDKCPCGCGIDKSGTAVNHAMQFRMFEIDNKIRTSIKQMLQDRHNQSILKHIEDQNNEFLKEQVLKESKEMNPIVSKSLIFIAEIGLIFGGLSLLGAFLG